MVTTPPKDSVEHTLASIGQSPRLLDQVGDRIRVLHYSIRTEAVYLDWIKRYIRHFDKRHPNSFEAAEVEAFLTHLTIVGKVAAARIWPRAPCLYSVCSCDGDGLAMIPA